MTVYSRGLLEAPPIHSAARATFTICNLVGSISNLRKGFIPSPTLCCGSVLGVPGSPMLRATFEVPIASSTRVEQMPALHREN